MVEELVLTHVHFLRIAQLVYSELIMTGHVHLNQEQDLVQKQ